MTTQFSKFQHEHPGLLLIALVTSIASMIAIFCYRDAARKVPNNYILLFLFTLSKAYMVSSSISYVEDQEIVVIAACMTLVMTVSLSVYALTTKKDFTLMGSTLFIFAAALFMLVLFSWMFRSLAMQILICCGCIVLYGFYLVYDTQLILGNKRYGLSTDDYIIGAMVIYVDIIVLFMRLVKLLRLIKKR